MCEFHRLLPTSGEGFMPIVALEKYLLRTMVMCSVLILSVPHAHGALSMLAARYKRLVKLDMNEYNL